MDELVSIIVPVYNVSAYLRKCVESLVNQTYKRIEIILVDDGSTDNSGFLCDEWKKTDSRIVVIHKENGGLSDARNAGIDICHGDYILFVDSDDSIPVYTCELLLETKNKYDSDIVISSTFLEYEDGRIVDEDKVYHEPVTVSGIEAIKNVFAGKGYSAWGKLYKRKLFQEQRFPKGRIDEDFATAYKIFFLADRVTYIPDNLYYYLKRSGSIMKSPFCANKMDFIVNAEEAVEYARCMMCDSEMIERAEAFLCNRIDMVIHLILFDANSENFHKELAQLVQQLRVHWKTVFFSRHIDNRDRAVMISEMLNPNIYRFFKTIKAQKGNRLHEQ